MANSSEQQQQQTRRASECLGLNRILDDDSWDDSVFYALLTVQRKLHSRFNHELSQDRTNERERTRSEEFHRARLSEYNSYQ